MSDVELEKFGADNAKEFQRLCRNERLRKLVVPVYFLLLGFVVGFLFNGLMQ